MSMILRSLAIWFAIIAVEIVHGILRRLLLVPAIGELRSNQIGVFVGSAFILVVVFLFYGWLKADSLRAKLLVGFLWCLLTFFFELVLGHIVGYSIEQVLASYNPIQGGFMLFGMAIMLLSVLIFSNFRAK